MSVLAIETATDSMGVALVDDRRVLASYELLADRPHAIELAGAVQRVLASGGAALEALEAIVVDIGPGSFTGLRIGLAFVKALSYPRKIPVVGVPSLDVLSAGVAQAATAVCPLLDAKQRKVYAAVYQPKDGVLTRASDYELLPVAELTRVVPAAGPVLFLGDGAGLYRAQLSELFGARATVAASEWWWPRAATLGRLGLERFRQGRKDDPQTLTPMYLYPMDCMVHKPSAPTPATAFLT